jgi:hypothetical protein
VNPRRAASSLNLAAPAVAAWLWLTATAWAESPTSYIGRPVYSDPTSGLQLPPACIIEPTWRSRISGTEMEVWVLNCDSMPRVWLLTRQIVEMLNAHDARLRFQVLDERVLAEESVGDSLSVQCSGANDESGIAVYGARWRASGHELHLAGARGALRGDVARHRLVDLDLAGVDCVRFPDREAMMRKLQQIDHLPR